MNTPELLSPAGTLKNMRYAFAYGADAVYAGQPRYSLRVRNNEFSKEPVLAQGIEEAHALGKRFFLASNLAPHNNKVKTYLADLEPIVEMGPDALIMSDPGLIMMVRERWPDLTIHLSVQSNVVNYAAVKFWQGIGLKRIILSRELSLQEVAEIRELCPDIELEVFVHGALCIAYSGRCLLSGYLSHRDSNQGACTNTCRWKYDAHEARETGTGDIVPIRTINGGPAEAEHEELPVVLLEEETRPGELMPAFEDEHGTYIMNSKDLRAVQHVHELAAMGIDSLKIEGRTRSFYYTARTTQVYRRAIDDAAAGRPFDMDMMEELEGLANRGYTEGFYRRHPPGEYQNYERGASRSDLQQFVGDVVDLDDGMLTIDVRNRFETGDQMELVMPSGNLSFSLDTIIGRDGKPADAAPGSGHIVRIPLPEGAADHAIGDYALLVRYLPRTVQTAAGKQRLSDQRYREAARRRPPCKPYFRSIGGRTPNTGDEQVARQRVTQFRVAPGLRVFSGRQRNAAGSAGIEGERARAPGRRDPVVGIEIIAPHRAGHLVNGDFDAIGAVFQTGRRRCHQPGLVAHVVVGIERGKQGRRVVGGTELQQEAFAPALGVPPGSGQARVQGEAGAALHLQVQHRVDDVLGGRIAHGAT